MAVAPQRSAQGAPSVLAEPGAHASPGQSAVLRVHARNITTQAQDLVFSAIGLEGAWLPAPGRGPRRACGRHGHGRAAAPAAGRRRARRLPVRRRGGGARPRCRARDDPGRGRAARRRRQRPGAQRRARGLPRRAQARHPGGPGQHRGAARPGAARRPRGRRPRGRRWTPTTSTSTAHQTVRIPGQVRALRPRVVGSTRRSPFHVVATGRGRRSGSTAPSRCARCSRRPCSRPSRSRWCRCCGSGPCSRRCRWCRRWSRTGRRSRRRSRPRRRTDGGPTAAAGGGGEADAHGREAPPPAGPLVPGVRVAGQVTGSEPAGVQVQVAPASAFAPEGTETPPSTAPGATGGSSRSRRCRHRAARLRPLAARGTRTVAGGQGPGHRRSPSSSPTRPPSAAARRPTRRAPGRSRTCPRRAATSSCCPSPGTRPSASWSRARRRPPRR